MQSWILEALELARAAGQLEVERAALNSLFYGAAVLGSPAWRLRLADYEALFTRYPHPAHEVELYLLRMMAALLDGDPIAARELATTLEGLAVKREQPDAVIYSGSGFIQAARETVGMGVLL